MCKISRKFPSFSRFIPRISLALVAGSGLIVGASLIAPLHCSALPASEGFSPASSAELYSTPLQPTFSSFKGTASCMPDDGTDQSKPCKERPPCDEYYVHCYDATERGQMIHLDDDDEIYHKCVIKVDNTTCEHLRKIGKLDPAPKEPKDTDPLPGPFLDPEKELFHSLLPERPLTSLGVWDISHYCLYKAHEVDGHGSGLSCPRCKEEQEAYQLQVRCLQEQYQSYCAGSKPIPAACDTLKDSIDAIKRGIDFNACLCSPKSTCETCHSQCLVDGKFRGFCDALKENYCPKQQTPSNPPQSTPAEPSLPLQPSGDLLFDSLASEAKLLSQ